MSDALTMLRGALSSESDVSATRLTPTPGFPGLDPALTQAVDTSLLGAYIETREALAGLSPVEAAAGRVHWRTPDSVEIVTSSRGMVLATRGLGADLHAADASQTEALIATGRAGQASRRHVYLDGIYRTQSVSLSCRVERSGEQVISVNNRAHRVIRFDETCSGASDVIRNSYWRDAAAPGIIRQSIQWVGEDVGRLHLQRLVD